MAGYVNGSAAGNAVNVPPAMMNQQVASPSTSNLNRHRAGGFRPAMKYGVKARIALVGVSGSGKSLTALILARELAGATGKIAAIDTEHGSLSLYAHSPACPPDCTDPTHFVFDTDEPESYTSEYLLNQLTCAEENGYSVFLVDSLSHFWMGKDGANEFVDSVKKRLQNRDGMEAWKAFAPHERAMVDRFKSSPCHVIVTMRVKTDYEEIEVNGKKRRVKVGLAPVQRQGLEYEFDLVGSMDDENNLLIDKTRCSIYSQERMRVVSRPTAAYFRPFIQWLSGPTAPTRVGTPESHGAPPVTAVVQEALRIDTGGNPIGTQAAADYVRDQKLQNAASAPSAANGGNVSVPPPVTTTAANPATEKPWTNRGEMRRVFANLREIVGETAYNAELEKSGVKDPSEFRRGNDAEVCYVRLLALADKEVA